MKILIKVALLPMIMAICTTVTYGQQGESQQNAAIQIQDIRKELNLSSGQLDEAEALTTQKNAAIADLLRDKNEDLEERREKLLAIWQDWDKEMQQILKANQAKAYAALKMEYKEKLFAAFDKQMGKGAPADNNASEMDADIMEADQEEIVEELESEENVDEALQGAEDVEFD